MVTYTAHLHCSKQATSMALPLYTQVKTKKDLIDIGARGSQCRVLGGSQNPPVHPDDVLFGRY